MNKAERVGNPLIAVDRMSDSLNPDVQIMVEMRIFSTLLAQLFLLQQHRHMLSETIFTIAHSTSITE